MLIFLTIVIIYPVTYIYQSIMLHTLNIYNINFNFLLSLIVIIAKWTPSNDLSVLASSVAVLEGVRHDFGSKRTVKRTVLQQS